MASGVHVVVGAICLYLCGTCYADPKIAIIGAGVGGAAAAYEISQQDSDAEIWVFEKNECPGGRLFAEKEPSVARGSGHMELGGSHISDVNYHINSYLTDSNLNQYIKKLHHSRMYRAFQDSSCRNDATWDGQMLLDVPPALQDFGAELDTLRQMLRWTCIADFASTYERPDFPFFRSVDQFTTNSKPAGDSPIDITSEISEAMKGWMSGTTTGTKKKLGPNAAPNLRECAGMSTEDFVERARAILMPQLTANQKAAWEYFKYNILPKNIHANYNQDLEINAVAGSVGNMPYLYIPYAIEDGNARMPDGLLKASGATVCYNTAVDEVSLIRKNDFQLVTRQTSGGSCANSVFEVAGKPQLTQTDSVKCASPPHFDAVIIAAPVVVTPNHTCKNQKCVELRPVVAGPENWSDDDSDDSNDSQEQQQQQHPQGRQEEKTKDSPTHHHHRDITWERTGPQAAERKQVHFGAHRSKMLRTNSGRTVVTSTSQQSKSSWSAYQFQKVITTVARGNLNYPSFGSQRTDYNTIITSKKAWAAGAPFKTWSCMGQWREPKSSRKIWYHSFAPRPINVRDRHFKNLEIIATKEWLAYPKLAPVKQYQDMEPLGQGQGLIFQNAVEQIFSTMETSVIAGKNSCKLLEEDGLLNRSSWREFLDHWNWD